MTEPKVSVIIPTFNHARLLGRAVRSVLGQTWQSYELIIVDDGSSDETPEVIAGFADERIRAIKHEQNKGKSAALNNAGAVAQGSYVAFLDDDDEWLPEKLGKQVKLLDEAPSGVGLIYTWRQLVDETGETPPATAGMSMRGDLYEQMLRWNLPVPASTWMVTREALESVGGFNEKIRVSNDLEFIVRLCERGWHVDVVPQVLVVKYKHALAQLTDPTPENVEARKAELERHMRHFEEKLRSRPSTKAHLYRRMIRYEIQHGTPSRVVELALKSLCEDPLGTARGALRAPKRSLQTVAKMLGALRGTKKAGPTGSL